MSKILLALLYPFTHKFYFGDGDAVETPPVELNAEPVQEETPNPETVEEEAAPKTYTEEEVKKLRDDDAAKIRNKLERKLEKQRIEFETRAQVEQELKQQQKELSEAEPKLDDFTDYADYVKALAKHTVKVERAQAEQQRNQEQIQKAENEKAQTYADKQNAIWEKGNSKFTEFDDIATKTGEHLKSKGLKFSSNLLDALVDSSNAEDIVHHLGVNLDDAERIAKLSPMAQAKEIWQLEQKFATKTVKTTKAPTPASPIEGGKNLTKRLDEMTYAEMVEHDKKRGAKYMSKR